MPRRQKHGVDNPKRRGEAPPFWSLGVQGRSRNAPAVLLGDKKGGILSRERMPPLPVQRHRRCPPPPMAGKRKSPTTFVVMLYGAGDEARSRHCRAATRTAGDKRPTGAFSRFARALFDPLPAGTKKSALLRRTSVLRSKTLAEGEFTSPEHLNFLPESKKRGHNIRCDLFFWSGRRGSNSLPPPWQGGALPDELRPRNKMYYTRHFSLCQA